MRRGEGGLVSLDPTVGTEIQKTRPCLVMSPDELNSILRRVIVAPITGGSHPAPFRIPVTFRQRSGLILLDQIRTVDRKRAVTRMGSLERVTVEAALKVLAGMFAP